MLHSLSALLGNSVIGEDGMIGTLKDYIFHDREWAVRYLIVDMDGDGGGRDVLISPIAIEMVDEEQKSLRLSLSNEMVRNSPMINYDHPLSRELETQVHDYFEWPYYWEDEKVIPNTGPGDLTAVPLAEMEIDLEQQQEEMAEEAGGKGVANLHKFTDIVGFSIKDRDEKTAGKIDDFIIDDTVWTMMYCIVETGGLLSGKKVIVSPSLIDSIDWQDSDAYADLDDETIEKSPEFDLELLRRDEFPGTMTDA